MAMSASDFFTHFKRLNAYVAQNKNSSADLQEAFRALTTSFKSTYTPDAFRQAISGNEDVTSDLEERITTALMALNRERAVK